MKKKRMILELNERQLEMIEEIKDELGYPTNASIVRDAIIQLYKKVKPGYVKPAVEPMSAEDRERRKADRKAAEEKVELERVTRICEVDLGGEVRLGKTGNPVCHYYTYSGKSRYEMQVPLNLITDDIVTNQYEPSRAAVEKLQREGKVNYEVKKTDE